MNPYTDPRNKSALLVGFLLLIGVESTILLASSGLPTHLIFLPLAFQVLTLGCVFLLNCSVAELAVNIDDNAIELCYGSRTIWRAEWDQIRRVTLGEPHVNDLMAKMKPMWSVLKLLPGVSTTSTCLVLYGDGWTHNLPLATPIRGRMESADTLLAEVRRRGFDIEG